jgi:hypothetical protein
MSSPSHHSIKGGLSRIGSELSPILRPRTMWGPFNFPTSARKTTASPQLLANHMTLKDRNSAVLCIYIDYV